MSDSNRPAARLSREMRLLIVTILVAGGVLLLLARLRFPEPPVPLDTSTQPLERLAARASFEELATRVARLETSVAPNLIVLSLASENGSHPVGLEEVSLGAETHDDARHVPALRIDATTAAACVSPDARIAGIVGEAARVESADTVGRDVVRHLARVRVPEGRPVALRQLALSDLRTPTYVVAVEGTRAGVTIRPVFLGRSDRFTSPRWTRPLLPLGGAVVTAGALIFTLEGEFLGCAVVDEGTAAIASGTDVLGDISRADSSPGKLVEPGITVQRSTPEIAAATGIRDGVVVAEVLEGGPASTVLQSGDVITEMDGRPVGDPKSLLLDLGARLREGPVKVAFVREQQVRHGELRSPGRSATARESSELKLELVRGVGAKVVSVPDNSPFMNAGLAPDDTILRIGTVGAPTPAEVSSAFREAPPGRFLLLVVRRGPRQHVTAVKKEDRSDVVAR